MTNTIRSARSWPVDDAAADAHNQQIAESICLYLAAEEPAALQVWPKGSIDVLSTSLNSVNLWGPGVRTSRIKQDKPSTTKMARSTASWHLHLLCSESVKMQGPKVPNRRLSISVDLPSLLSPITFDPATAPLHVSTQTMSLGDLFLHAQIGSAPKHRLPPANLVTAHATGSVFCCAPPVLLGLD